MIKTTEQKVLKFIDQHSLINKADRILISLSGGADSVFLLHFLFKFKRRLGIQIGAFHLNHGLRGKDASEDESFCKAICKEMNVDCFTVSKNVKAFAAKKKLSVEEAGRELRYDELQKVADKNNYSKIATAHNATDNAETMLLNLIKGTGLQGISGIPFQRGNIIRPVLILTKKEILNYLQKKGINYRTDISNLSNNYERNFLRNEILPKLKSRLNPQLENSLFTSSENFKRINFFINGLIEKAIHSSIKRTGARLSINLNKLNQLDVSLLGNFFKSLIEKHFKLELTSSGIQSLNSLIHKQSGRRLILGNKLICVKERNEIIIFKQTKKEKVIFKFSLKAGETKKIGKKKFSINLMQRPGEIKNKNKNIEYISADNLPCEFEIRNWIEGDRFKPLGMKGTKKISDFLSEQKIPPSKKKSQLMLTNSGKIVWVIGLRIDDRFKIDANTKQVYKLCLS